ncbi:hypothetical protein B296_00017420 [Ensete ventricosum]|uniref:Uncharacterized protein n=1 Tax=Ensete ventricosum TaxID=4639 RepID=A0A427AZ02_ENSVE|nr:hypothetical protein B296_00017420 [Ensete ventricosum]
MLSTYRSDRGPVCSVQLGTLVYHVSVCSVTETIKDESGVIEERDPRYDEMLRHMVGKITSRSGGKLEMGEVIGTPTARYRAVPPKIDHRWSISAVDGRLREKLTVGGRLKKKKGRRRREKEEKRRGEERIPRTVVARRRFFSRVRRRDISLRGEKDQGDAGIVERYNRPMPKLRSSREEAGASGQKPLPPGTLSVEQVRQIILLHQGKAVEHPGPMDIQDIANKFGVDAAQVQQITRFMSLPPQDGERKTQ